MRRCYWQRPLRIEPLECRSLLSATAGPASLAELACNPEAALECELRALPAHLGNGPFDALSVHALRNLARQEFGSDGTAAGEADPGGGSDDEPEDEDRLDDEGDDENDEDRLDDETDDDATALDDSGDDESEDEDRLDDENDDQNDDDEDRLDDANAAAAALADSGDDESEDEDRLDDENDDQNDDDEDRLDDANDDAAALADSGDDESEDDDRLDDENDGQNDDDEDRLDDANDDDATALAEGNNDDSDDRLEDQDDSGDGPGPVDAGDDDPQGDERLDGDDSQDTEAAGASVNFNAELQAFLADANTSKDGDGLSYKATVDAARRLQVEAEEDAPPAVHAVLVAGASAGSLAAGENGLGRLALSMKPHDGDLKGLDVLPIDLDTPHQFGDTAGGLPGILPR